MIIDIMKIKVKLMIMIVVGNQNKYIILEYLYPITKYL